MVADARLFQLAKYLVQRVFPQGRLKFGREHLAGISRPTVAFAVLRRLQFLAQVSPLDQVFLELLQGVRRGKDAVFRVQLLQPVKRFLHVARRVGEQLFKNPEHPIEGFFLLGNLLAEEETLAGVEWYTVDHTPR